MLFYQGTRFCIWLLGGDHEHFSNCLKLPHWNKPMWCWECIHIYVLVLVVYYYIAMPCRRACIVSYCIVLEKGMVSS